MAELSERQIDIIRATIALIGEEGVHNFSIRKLARRVGVTEPAVYRHFENKDDLMVKVAEYVVQNWNSLFLEIKIPQLPLIEQIQVIFENVIQSFDDNRLFARTVFSADLFSSDSGMAGVLRKLKRDGVTLFAEMLRDGQKEGEINAEVDYESVTHIFFGAVEWVVSDWISEGYIEDLNDKWHKVWLELERLLH